MSQNNRPASHWQTQYASCGCSSCPVISTGTRFASASCPRCSRRRDKNWSQKLPAVPCLTRNFLQKTLGSDGKPAVTLWLTHLASQIFQNSTSKTKNGSQSSLEPLEHSEVHIAFCPHMTLVL